MFCLRVFRVYICECVSVCKTVYVFLFTHMFTYSHMLCVTVHLCVRGYLLLTRRQVELPQKHPTSPDPPSHTCKTHTYTLVLSSMNSPSSNTCLHPQVGAVWSFRLLCSVQLLCPKTKGSGPEEWRRISIKFTREAVKRQWSTMLTRNYSKLLYIMLKGR